MNKKVFIGVAWPYVNGNLHIGHLAGYLLPADIFARYNRSVGNEVLMVSGSDCFGTPITVEADKRGKKPTEIVEEYHEKDVHLFKDILELSYDLYTKTSTEQHIKITQDFFVKLLENGYIFIDKSLQYYSPIDNKFLPDRYVVGKCPFCGFLDARSDQCDNCGRVLNQGELINPISNLTKQAVELKETQHYFIDWPKLQPKIKEFFDTHSAEWKDWVKAETLGWLTEGLKPRAITRDIDWGVPIPEDRIPKDKLVEGASNKKIYVWFDAVIGYYSASLLWAHDNNKDWKPFWYDSTTKHYYFMGKDNLIFHTIFWPGQLLGFDPALNLPNFPSINMFLDLNGEKFSKSRGVTIDIKEIVEKYGNDRVRFYITLIMPEHRDSSFNWNDFKEKNNGVLVANIGNYIHRTLSIGYGTELTPSTAEISTDVLDQVDASFKEARMFLDKCEFKNYLDVIIKLSSYGNKLCDLEKVWTLKKEDPVRFAKVLKDLYVINVALSYLMSPIMPHASDELKKMLKISLTELWPESIKSNSAFANKAVLVKLHDKPQPLFQKIELEA